MKISKVLKSLFSAELLWEKDKAAPILKEKDVLDLTKKLINFKLDVAHAAYADEQRTPFKFNIESYFGCSNTLYSSKCIILNLFNKFPDNLFLCGGSVLSILTNTNVNDYDIFFCCKNYQEAEEILTTCLIHLNAHVRKYTVSQHVITLETEIGKIQFIRRIYNTPDQILLGFDLWACQHGWNVNIGYFTLLTGAFSLITHSFPINLNKRGLAYENRLNKYFREKYFDILLPGVDIHHDQEIKTPGGDFYLKCLNGKFYDIKTYSTNQNFRIIDCKKNCKSTVFRLSYPYGSSNIDDDYSSNAEFNIKFLQSKENLVNMITLHTNDVDGSYETKEYKKLLNINLDFILKGNIIRGWNISNENQNFHNKTRISNDEKQKLIDYINILNDPSKRWKYDNPGGKTFGIFNLNKISIVDWYGYNKPKYYIGIESDIYILIYTLCKENKIPKDIMKLICRHVIIAQSVF